MKSDNRPNYMAKLGFYKVERIIDADTLIVSSKNGNQGKIRLAYIDAPEKASYWARPFEKYQKNNIFYKSQYNWSNKANLFVKEILRGREKLQLRIIEKDRYGRYVSEVYTDNSFLQCDLLMSGLSSLYFSYIEGCSLNNAYKLFASQKIASDESKNIWSDGWLIYPNLFRILKKHHASYHKTIEDKSEAFKQATFDTLNNRLSEEYKKDFILKERQDIDEFEMLRRFKTNCVDIFGNIKWS